ncbi:amino acid permease [Companilactobacillus suantsaicola]|uniref:Amino acid permease n=1 Tax=Companilactobacillus suantsaicola TaxID=2487723 RepID=A0A4Z0JHF6_9LACO|nr:amino acid permease [Companilactobacillus suantsaicola]TGD21449.1 amino acid permease [Companilactobacillus suantsaicola]
MSDGKNAKTFRWWNIALVGFTTVWGLNNVINNFANQGLAVVTSWILIMVLYFVPYTLMVGQLGSAFQEESGGVSSWVRALSNNKLAYFAAWTYWVVHVPYLAQKPQIIMVSLSWLFKGNGSFVNQASPFFVQGLSLIIFLAFVWVASKGVATLNNIGSIAGIAMFTMSMLFIILGVSAPFITHVQIATPNMTDIHTYIPKFDFQYFTTISMLVFAVGGCEKISPYVNKTKNASKEFPLGMIILAVMVAVSAVLGSFAIGMIVNSNHIPADLMANGAYQAFQFLGQSFHVGNLFVWAFAITNTLTSAAALAISIDAPLRMLLGDADSKFIPKALSKKNEHGIAINGYKMTAVLVSILIIVPALGINGMNDLYNWLLNLNSIVMPMRYLWVFFAFMMLSKQMDKYQSDYMFVKNKAIGFGLGLWTFFLTAFACIMGMVPKMDMAKDPSSWWFQLALNIITPLALIALGLILPAIAKRTNPVEDFK